MYCYVRYLLDNANKTIPASFIDDFDPLTFSNRKIYESFWSENGDVKIYSKVQVLLIAQTEEEVEKLLASQRLKIPKIYGDDWITANDSSSAPKRRRRSKKTSRNKTINGNTGQEAWNVGRGSKILWKCDRCDKTFTRSFGLKLHVLIHDNEKPHKCKACLKSFRLVHHLRLHKCILGDESTTQNQQKNLKKTAQNQQKDYQTFWKCDLCDKMFTRSSGLKFHALIHDNKKPHRCKACGKSFRLAHHLKIHKCGKVKKPSAPRNQPNDLKEMKHVEWLTVNKQNQPEKVGPKCELCNKEFSQIADVADHMQIHQKDPSPCPECGKVFKLWHQYMSHICIELNETNDLALIKKTFNCETCDQKFLSLYYYKRHFPCHVLRTVGNRLNERNENETNEPMQKNSVQCEICSQTFSRLQGLKRHEPIHDSSLRAAKDFLCEICGKLYYNLCVLQDHQGTHTKKKPWLCDICGKQFGVKSALKLHGCSHLEKPARNYVCHLCDKGFRIPCSLKLHMRVHTKERPFSCDICGKRYPYRYALETHRYTHTNVKSFACSCGKRFKTPYSLYAHRRYAHSGKETRVTCELCNKTFCDKCSLKGHYLTHTKEKPWKCRLCGKGFAHRKFFRQHQALCK